MYRWHHTLCQQGSYAALCTIWPPSPAQHRSRMPDTSLQKHWLWKLLLSLLRAVAAGLTQQLKHCRLLPVPCAVLTCKVAASARASSSQCMTPPVAMTHTTHAPAQAQAPNQHLSPPSSAPAAAVSAPVAAAVCFGPVVAPTSMWLLLLPPLAAYQL